MKRALVCGSIAALLSLATWAVPAQATDECQLGNTCSRDCSAYFAGASPGESIDDIAKACYTDGPVKAATDLGVSSPSDTTNGQPFPEIEITSQLEPGQALVRTARAKTINGFTISHPNRVTAMAKRFSAAPGDVINIHGYGPDRETALKKADYVRENLQAEINRLGGDAASHPVFVTYAGDPDHKKGVDVTIHQHEGIKIR
jgi:hypothetical protein